MKVAVLTQSGEKKSDLTLSKNFDVTVSSEAVTLYINYLRAALRGPVANTKDRGAVSGGGKKPYRQKGTGNARAGSSRSPLWTGGGVTFGPSSDQNFRIRINSKQRKQVILGVFSDFIRNKKMLVIENLSLSNPKTKKASDILENIKADGKISVIASKEDANAQLSFRNLAGIKIMMPSKLDFIHLFSSDLVVVSQKALEEIGTTYTTKG